MHPWQTKLVAFYCYFNRFLNIPMDRKSFTNKYHTILDLAKPNDFPFHVIHNLFKKIERKQIIQNLTSLQVQTKSKTFFSIPYISLIYTIVSNCVKSINMIPCSSNKICLRNLFCRKLDFLKKTERSGIYKVTCDCGAF